MATTTFTLNYGIFEGIRSFKRRVTARGLWFGLILLAALIAFELFNFATTEYALDSLFGSQNTLGVATWARVLAIAFCGIDFAGLSRLFTPETGRKEPKEIWLLTGAWFLGAGMNAIMTWWAVGSALSTNPALGNELLSRAQILNYGPVFIAALVWLTRILIIGTFAFAGDHIFTTAFRAGDVVESSVRPISPARPYRPAVTRAEPRAVPKYSEPRVLPERSQPVASSSYAQADTHTTNRRQESQRSFFGRGAGSSLNPAASQPAAPAAVNTRVASQHSAAEGTQPAAEVAPTPAEPKQSSFFERSSAAPAKPKPALSRPFTRPAASSSNTAPAPRGRRDINRASTTRTLRRPARESSSDALAGQSQQATMELEYVDFD